MARSWKMMYPRGSVDLNRLKRIVESNKYNVWFEDSTQEPKDWNWQKDGFWRGELTPIKNIKAMIEARNRFCDL